MRTSAVSRSATHRSVAYLVDAEGASRGRVQALGAAPGTEGLVAIRWRIAPGDLEADPVAQRLEHQMHADGGKGQTSESEPGNRISRQPGPTLAYQEQD